RRITEGRKEMSRLYVIETTPSITGANADHRWSIRPAQFEETVRGLASSVALRGAAPGDLGPPFGGPIAQGWMQALSRDLLQHGGSSIVIAGAEQSPVVHALAHAMNASLGNVGKTVFYTDTIEAYSIDQSQSLHELVTDIDEGRVELLVIVGGNPTYNTPADLKLDKQRLFKINLRVHHGQYKDETGELCHWHIPATHYLESWSDTRSYDGTVSIVQPLIEPLYESKSEHELLAVFSDQYDKKAYDIIRDYWRQNQEAGGRRQEAVINQAAGGRRPEAGGAPTRGSSPSTASPASTPAAAASPVAAASRGDFDSWWRKCLHDGFIPNTALPVKTVTADSNGIAKVPQTPSAGGYAIVFRTDPSIYDGRFSNNGWLQELPKPLTKVTWDNAALVSPATARKLNLGKSPAVKGRESYVDTIKISHQGRTISDTVPTFIMPGQPDDVITVHLGYGRQRAGRVGNKHGFNAYEIRTSDSPWLISGAEVSKASGQYVLATTQLHFNMEDYSFRQDDRDILRVETLAEYLEEKEE